MKRDWKSWPYRLAQEINWVSSITTIGSALLAFAAAKADMPNLVTAAPFGLAIGLVVLALYRSFPERKTSASSLAGKVIEDLDSLELISPPLKKIGLLGVSRAGKTTTVFNLRASIPETASRTDKPYAHVTALPSNPLSFFAILDAAGQQFSQQFRVAEISELILIFLDHNAADDSSSVITSRLQEHEHFIDQLQWNFKEKLSKAVHVHFMLNKQDQWKDSPDKPTLLSWFDAQIKKWEKIPMISVTSSYHSNFVVEDHAKLATFLRERIALGDG